MIVKNKKRINYPQMLSGIRVSDADYERLKRDAEKTGLKFADHIRQLLVKGKSVNTDALASIRREINKIGTNINQIAHQANSQSYDPSMYDAILAEITKLREKVCSISL
jgi:flagellin-like hook-associated protein FlgL